MSIEKPKRKELAKKKAQEFEALPPQEGTEDLREYVGALDEADDKASETVREQITREVQEDNAHERNVLKYLEKLKRKQLPN